MIFLWNRDSFHVLLRFSAAKRSGVKGDEIVKTVGLKWSVTIESHAAIQKLIKLASFFLFITSTFLRFFTCILRNHNEYRSIPALFQLKDSKWKKTKAMSFRWNVIRIIPSRTRIKHEVYEIRALAFEFNFYCWSKKEKKIMFPFQFA